MAQTAMQKLISTLKDIQKVYVKDLGLKMSIANAEALLELEQEQLEDAFDSGNPNGFIVKDGKQYYNETFKNSMSKIEIEIEHVMGKIKIAEEKKLEVEEKISILNNDFSKLQDILFNYYEELQELRIQQQNKVKP
jgi:hypothetical protein